ncbi:hypothetical protein [Burkholderia cepacia]|uniref:hypothetical protein n=1 Tax=Burkholderia cepacia TaxID=292 RepID=UPI0011D27D6A|nr:hypothetical protein [Burkholderia cepacia]
MNGEVDWLAYLEAPSFFVNRNGVHISKSEEIAFIEVSRRKFPNKRTNDVKYTEVIDQMRERKNWATVYGSAQITRDGEVASQFDFFELWVIVESRWQVVMLCIEDIDHARKI